MPDWCDRVEAEIDGKTVVFTSGDEAGYIYLDRVWQPGEQVELCFNMPVLRMKGHPNVRHVFGKVALQRGPFVYCLEEADNGAGLYQLRLPVESEFEVVRDDSLRKGLNIIQAAGERCVPNEAAGWSNHLYQSHSQWHNEHTTLKFIPYFTWANRGLGEMSVWVEES
ncbi:Non-reducing end beta-L-arabinofuranosidase [compost metagenome]